MVEEHFNSEIIVDLRKLQRQNYRRIAKVSVYSSMSKKGVIEHCNTFFKDLKSMLIISISYARKGNKRAHINHSIFPLSLAEVPLDAKLLVLKSICHALVCGRLCPQPQNYQSLPPHLPCISFRRFQVTQ